MQLSVSKYKITWYHNTEDNLAHLLGPNISKWLYIKTVKVHRFVETFRLSNFLHNWLTDGGEVVSPTHCPLLQEDWYTFLLRDELTTMATACLERIG
jgi:hypothetical protein